MLARAACVKKYHGSREDDKLSLGRHTHTAACGGGTTIHPDSSLARAQIDVKPSRMSPLFPSIFRRSLTKQVFFSVDKPERRVGFQSFRPDESFMSHQTVCLATSLRHRNVFSRTQRERASPTDVKNSCSFSQGLLGVFGGSDT